MIAPEEPLAFLRRPDLCPLGLEFVTFTSPVNIHDHLLDRVVSQLAAVWIAASPSFASTVFLPVSPLGDGKLTSGLGSGGRSPHHDADIACSACLVDGEATAARNTTEERGWMPGDWRQLFSVRKTGET